MIFFPQNVLASLKIGKKSPRFVLRSVRQKLRIPEARGRGNQGRDDGALRGGLSGLRDAGGFEYVCAGVCLPQADRFRAQRAHPLQHGHAYKVRSPGCSESIHLHMDRRGSSMACAAPAAHRRLPDHISSRTATPPIAPSALRCDPQLETLSRAASRPPRTSPPCHSPQLPQLSRIFPPFLPLSSSQRSHLLRRRLRPRHDRALLSRPPPPVHKV